MARRLTVLFRRDPSRDRQKGSIAFTGYETFWPDGRPLTVGLEAFCRRGLRLLGLDKYLAGRHERLIDIVCFPLPDMEAAITRLPGHRVRRFYLQRSGPQCRLHFMDGTPTDTVFDVGRDETRVLEWIGFFSLKDGERQWLDLAAQATVESAEPCLHPPLAVLPHAESRA